MLTAPGLSSARIHPIPIPILILILIPIPSSGGGRELCERVPCELVAVSPPELSRELAGAEASSDAEAEDWPPTGAM